ncbi:Cytochrome b subunit of formate dehydrogenase [Malonomonas rubra DSM 5091]|uniref:Cytochrome b subunit of formate dehydrogenase n=1 Tax=Malonomonas rubra DSM 5091 TaxID=1122189 RepID=A0A1M6HFM7_MALRU|nr:cytochrome c3 family protein [Malonomonas rubra]SHJ20987.1 Cytochrome b subunit of formate dehydrogenase [Malonomonas rubra DSM 5091]
MRTTRLLIIVSLLFWALGSQALAENLIASPEACLECHEDVVSAEEFANSVHGANGCVACHIELTDLDLHMEGELMPEEVKCVRCHKQETAEHYASVHQLNDIGCASCHSEIHAQQAWHGDKRIANQKCAECHDDAHEVFHESAHGKALQAGNMDSAACLDCHNLHAIKELGDPNDHDVRAFHTDVCLKCHADEELMDKNGVTHMAVETYLSSYHGKNYSLGYPELVAGCADCHTSHAILPHDDPNSSLHPENLVSQCGKCHENSSAQFVKFYSHGNMHDKENYPILYYTYLAMTGLLLGTFAVFWIHTLLWLFRGFVENREKKRALIAGHHHVIPDAHKIYRRFTKVHIVLHLLVITSFLLLSVTGIPLKFANQPWAVVMMDFYGGADVAAFLHRVGAAITGVYFGAALYMSAIFLFKNLQSPAEFVQRLFGPDSLFPNLRDIQDVTNMVRWFLFLGPKPTFERWTYWEKFDFIAVFWGMFAIGGSGLMLWFPEFFGSFLPGWVFNVATIIHSDEALLATGFIFTVHFFNTHGRPEKFPMDFVIFNGELPKEEFLEERGDQWKRYEEAGITETFVKEKPSGIAYDFFVKAFGFFAVFVGVSMLFLMVYAFITSGFH